MEIALLLLAIAGGLVAGGIAGNGLPMTDPPGFGKRLRTYLTTNVAETRRNHVFPELELPCFAQPPEVLLAHVEKAAQALTWESPTVDAETRRLRAFIVTPLLNFKDDIEIRLVPAAGCTELWVRSASRVGKGDLGANTRHILNLLQVLQQQS